MICRHKICHYFDNTPLKISDFYSFLSIPIKNDFEEFVFKDTRSTKKFILN